MFSLSQIVIAMLISQAAAVCWNVPDGTFVADPSDRRRYFWCNHGEGIPGKCAQGEVFDNGFCDEFKDPCTNRPDGFFAADPLNSRGFFWCQNGFGEPGTCPYDEIFYESDQACFPEFGPDYPDYPNSPCFDFPDDTFVADPSDRRRFFWCQDGEAIPGECDKGEIFFEGFCDVEETTTTTTTRRPVPPTRPPIIRTTTTRRAVPPTRPTAVRSTTTRPGPSTRPPAIRTTTTTRRAGPPTRPTVTPRISTTRPQQPTRRPVPTRQPPA